MRPCIWGGVPSVDAAAHISFNVGKVTLNGGELAVSGYLYNSGNSGGYVETIIIRNIRTLDRNGRLIWAASNVDCEADDIYVGAGEQRYCTFYYWSSDIPNRGVVEYDIDSRVIHRG